MVFTLKLWTRYKIVLLIVFGLVIWRGLHHINNQPFNFSLGANESTLPYVVQENAVKVAVYYEALCSDSRTFILKQLVPAFQLFHGLIDLDLVPFGKAKINEDTFGEITFHCQHGPIECTANKYHACGVALIRDQALQLGFVACMIKDNSLPHDAAEKCSLKLRINHQQISECANGETGSLYLKRFGLRTERLKPYIGFVPTIEFNGEQSVSLAKILKDLKKELCNFIQPTLKQCE